MNLIRKTVRRFCIICRRSLSGRRWVRPATKTCSPDCRRERTKLELRRKNKRIRQKIYHRRRCAFCKGRIDSDKRTKTVRFCSKKCSAISAAERLGPPVKASG